MVRHPWHEDTSETMREKLASFTVDELRTETAILHGLCVPDGFEIGWPSFEKYPWRGIGGFPDPTKVYWYTKLGETGLFLRLEWNGFPGWSWYISDNLHTYMERGGDCLFMRALADAAEAVREFYVWDEPWRERLQAFNIPAWWDPDPD